MSVLLTKTFAKKPDLVLELTGRENYVAKDLLRRNFTVQGSADHIPENESVEDARNKVWEQTTFKVRMHVSRKHLTEASPYFDALLNQNFKEAQENCVPLKDIPVMAFSLLMEILHQRTYTVVSQVISEATLFDVCTLIDMYTLHEQAFLHTNRWFDSLKTLIPDSPSPTLEEWTFVTYVLKKEQSFTNLTRVIQRKCVELEHRSDIPLPAPFLEDLKHSRLTALSRCVTALRNVIEKYEDETNIQCVLGDHDCDALVLGSLIRRLKKFNLYPPSLDTIQTLTIESLIQTLNDLNLRNLCEPSRRDSRYGFGGKTWHGAKDDISCIVDSLKIDTEGLTLPQN